MPERDRAVTLGAATSVVVTPGPGLPMGGYAARAQAAVGTLDDLEANVLWLQDTHGDDVIWISLDVLAINDAVRADLVRAVSQSTGVAGVKIVVVASHTHSGPAGWHGEIHPVLPTELDLEACERLIAAVGCATAPLACRLAPVHLTWHEGDVDGVGSNRHDVAGPHDRSVGVLAVRRLSDAGQVAVLFDHACHPTVLGPENLRWSADWVGAARARIRSDLARPTNDPLPVIFLQGSAGDISPRFHRRNRNLAEVKRLGSIVGDAVVRALREPGRDVAPSIVLVRRTTIDLPARGVDGPESPLPSGTVIGAGTVPVQDFMSTDAAERLRTSMLEGRKSRAAMLTLDLPALRTLPVSLVEVGNRRWLHLALEVCATLGAEISAGDPSLRVIGYSDSYGGYVADAASHLTGHYEALASFFDASSSEYLVTFCRDYVGRS